VAEERGAEEACVDLRLTPDTLRPVWRRRHVCSRLRHSSIPSGKGDETVVSHEAKRVHEQGTAREALRHGLLQSVHWRRVSTSTYATTSSRSIVYEK
jgi:hypothetical protein